MHFALAALAIAVAGWCTHLLAGLTFEATVFCLPTALSLGLTMRKGPVFGLAGAIGMGSYAALTGSPVQDVLFFAGAAGLGPAIAGYLHWRLPRAATEMTRRLRLMGLGLLVMAPISALCLFLAGVQGPLANLPVPVQFGVIWAVEAFSAVLFAPLALVWLTDDSLQPQNQSCLNAKLANWAIGVLCVLFAAAHVLGANKAFLAGQVLILISMGLVLLPVVVGNVRTSAMVVAGFSVAMVLEQAHFARSGASLVVLGPAERLAVLSAILFFGSLVMHMLNGIAIRSAAQQDLLAKQVLTNPSSGLPNRAFFFQSLRAMMGTTQRKNAFFGEISIPDLNYWAEFAGQETVHRVDALIANRLDRALKPNRFYLAHASQGSYMVNLQLTADPLAVIDAIESAVTAACEQSGVRRMRVRPQIALLRVPAEIEAGPEDIQASLALALRRSDKSQKRWSMATLQSGMLEKQREAIQDNESLVELLTRARVMVFSQKIQSLQDTADQGLHYEVLARMQRDSGEAVSPALFLPVYAAYGLLPQFDRVVIQSVFELFQAEPVLVRATKVVSINLTGPTIADPELLPFIEAQFAASALKPSQVTFEITESDHISNRAQALENVADLRRLGCAIALDDFGTGLATFAYLKAFRPDWIKIDGSFVKEAGASPMNREVVSSMIRVAKAAGAQVVAEQVEEQAHVDLMKVLGAHFVQGYGIARPEPLADLAARLRASSAQASGRSDVKVLAGVHQALGV